MMPPTIFSITITHPPCREGRVNHRPHPQLRRIKCQICHIWYRYLMFDRPSPPLRRINYQIYYIWCRYLIFDRPSPWLWRMPTRNLLFAFSSLSLPSWSDQCFFYVRKVINSYVIPRRTNCGNMPLWINGFLRPPSIFFWLRSLWAQNSRKSNSVCAQSTVQPWYISYKCKTINSLS